MAFNSANRKDIRAAEKLAQQSLVIRGEVISGIMSVTNGRQWMHELLSSLHFFTDPFTSDPYVHAANSGQRGIAIKLFGDIMGFCPKQFTQMIEEHYGRLSASDERTRKPDANGRDNQPSSATGAWGDYDPYTDDDPRSDSDART